MRSKKEGLSLHSRAKSFVKYVHGCTALTNKFKISPCSSWHRSSFRWMVRSVYRCVASLPNVGSHSTVNHLVKSLLTDKRTPTRKISRLKLNENSREWRVVMHINSRLCGGKGMAGQKKKHLTVICDISLSFSQPRLETSSSNNLVSFPDSPIISWQKGRSGN